MIAHARALLGGALSLAAALLPGSVHAQADAAFEAEIAAAHAPVSVCFTDAFGGQFGLVLDSATNIFSGYFAYQDFSYMASGARGTTSATLRHHVFSAMSNQPDSDPGCLDAEGRFDWGIWNGRITGGGVGTYTWTGDRLFSCGGVTENLSAVITIGTCPAPAAPVPPDAPTREPAAAPASEATPLVVQPEAAFTFCYVNNFGDQFQGTFVPAADVYYGPGVLAGVSGFTVTGGRGAPSPEQRHHSFTWQNPTAGAAFGCSGSNFIPDWVTDNVIVSGRAPMYSFSGVELDSCGGTTSLSGTITLGACRLPASEGPSPGGRYRGAVVRPERAAASITVAAGPNPFTASTTILYALSETSHVHLAVYDVLGREVAVLVDEEVAPGSHAAVFDGRGLPGGTYLYRLQAGGHTESHPITLAR